MTEAPNDGIPYAAIGEAVVEFALLELAIQTAVWPLISNDVPDGQSETWRLSTSRVLDRVEELIEGDVDDGVTTGNLRRTLKSAATDARALLSKRDDVVHGLWRGGDSPDVVRVREFVRSSGANISDTRYDESTLLRLAEEANVLSVRFTFMARVMWTRREERERVVN